jgi:hypothetical protein
MKIINTTGESITIKGTTIRANKKEEIKIEFKVVTGTVTGTDIPCRVSILKTPKLPKQTSGVLYIVSKEVFEAYNTSRSDFCMAVETNRENKEEAYLYGCRLLAVA